MVESKITPLEPRSFFTGEWNGEGELYPNPLFRWLFPKERLRFSGQPVWTSKDTWEVNEKFEFESGNIIERKMSVEITASDRLHVSADDMPLGADIMLYENRFCFTPYYIRVKYKGLRLRLKCTDENSVDDNGVIRDTIKMFFLGFPVASMRIRTTVERK